MVIRPILNTHGLLHYITGRYIVGNAESTGASSWSKVNILITRTPNRRTMIAKYYTPELKLLIRTKES